MITFSKLNRAGVLGMNRRNACYTLQFNPRKLYPLVDDKLKTKRLLEANCLPTPTVYFVIKHNFEIKYLNIIKRLQEFVIKPARGAQGRGIVVVSGKDGHGWRKANGDIFLMEEAEYHISNILAGLYSLGGVSDEAFLEYCVKTHDIFRSITYRGVPDIRMILYRGVPVMSMLRVPTKESQGKANLHQGAVGVGIEMKTGITFGGVCHDELIEKHPDTQLSLSGIQIPFWKEIIDISVKACKVFQLGYFGIDFVIDQTLGPLILELNARPGLSIQLANRAGLLNRLKAVDVLRDSSLQQHSLLLE
jgi:alpha-L-glutamate ligase-like protein